MRPSTRRRFFHLLASALAVASAPVAAGPLLLVGAQSEYRTLQAAVDDCPKDGCTIQIQDSALLLPREVWIEGYRHLAITRSPALAAAGIRPRLHHPEGFDPMAQAGTAANPADPARPAGWNRWPTSCKNAVGGSKDTTNPHSTSGFQQVGMIVVSGSTDILVEGVQLDGTAPRFLLNKGVWDCLYDVLFGNVGINLFKSGRVVVRDSEVRNFYAAIYSHGRNVGGAVALPNPNDLDARDVVPYSRFGQVGDHLVERNRIHGNVWAIASEMEWDLGSTFRHNLVWENSNPRFDSLAKASSEGQYATGGFLLVKDVGQAIHRIHNNTLWAMPRIVGYPGYRAGVQHLLYNNLVGGFEQVQGAKLRGSVHDFSNILPQFAEWMENNVFELGDSARRDTTFVRSWGNFRDSTLCSSVYGTPSATCLLTFDAPVTVRVPRNMGWMNWVLRNQGTYQAPFDGRSYPVADPLATEFYPGGGWIDRTTSMGHAGRDISAGANRWVRKFPLRSLDPASPDFLVPRWEDALAIETALGKGVPTSGWIRPDVGAVPSGSMVPLPWGPRSQERLEASGSDCYQVRLVPGPGDVPAGSRIARARLWSAPAPVYDLPTAPPKELPLRRLQDSTWSDGGLRTFCSDSLPRVRDGIRLQIVLASDRQASPSEEAHYLLGSPSIRYPVATGRRSGASGARIHAAGLDVVLSGLGESPVRIVVRRLDGKSLRSDLVVPVSGVVRIGGLASGAHLVEVHDGGRRSTGLVVRP